MAARARTSAAPHALARFARPATFAFVLVGALVAASLLSGCAGAAPSGSADSAPGGSPASEPPTELRVSAATTLKRAFEELAPGFEERTGVRLVYNFGSSGQLQKQIEGGAPVDVFASAGPRQVDALVASGLISAEETATFCGNEVVIFVPAPNPARIEGPAGLMRAARLATGDPETAPHGTKSREWLTTIGLWPALEARFVYGENAAQTLDFVARGEVDAGLGFASEALGRDDVEIVYTAPADEVAPARYVAAPLADAASPAAARAFVDYLLTSEAQAALAAHGFTTAGE